MPLVVLRVTGQGSEFLAFVLLARHLGTADFGRLSVAFLLCRYLGLVADWGASLRGPRDVAAGAGAGVAIALVRRRYVITAAMSVAYLAGVLALGRPEFALIAVTIVGRGLGRDWMALGQERAVRAGTPSALQGLVVLAGSVFVTRISTAAIPIAAGYAVGAVASIALNRLPHRGGEKDVDVSGWMLVTLLADQVTASTDTVLLAGLRSASEAGIYAAVYRLPNAWVTLIGLGVLALIPSATRRLAEDRHQLKALRDRALRRGALLAVVLAVTIPPSYFLVPTIFGDAYRAGQLPLLLLLIATAVNALAAPLHPIYVALARDRGQAGITSAAAILNVTANLVVIPLVGMSGAASTTLAAQLLLLILYWRGVSASIGR